jgi:alpha-L-glutamate ligase-like protein
MSYFVSPWALREQGVLGMNSRNIHYVARYNQRHLYPIVDDKLQTKIAAQKKGISVPKLLGVIENQWQLRNLKTLVSDWQEFVVKPTRGSGGKGILVIVGREQELYIKSSGQKIDLNGIHRHINNILSGLYSLGGKPDSVMLESLIHYDSVFNDYTHEGVPDIRVIVFQGFPVMAMLRCATHASDGRANLHQGAIGVGLNLLTGKSMIAVHHNKPILAHPDTGKSFADLQIPNWDAILLLAAGCFEMSGLGYIGCDIVLDKREGPIILELNARPGLAIQITNDVGLRQRLQIIENLAPEQLELTPQERIKHLPELF